VTCLSVARLLPVGGKPAKSRLQAESLPQVPGPEKCHSNLRDSINQKDLKSATIQTAPVMRKVKPNSDQFPWDCG